MSSTSATTATTTPAVASTTAPVAGAAISRANTPDSDPLSVGAKVGLSIAIAGAALAIGAMVAFFYFRRRRKQQDGAAGGGILDPDRRNGRRGREKVGARPGSASVSSGRSEEPLNPVQPISDGFPGSNGYDDVRSMHSSTHLHSPTWQQQSPTSSQHGAFFPAQPPERSSERDELTAARLLSSATLPTVVSYGPNRVTPTPPVRPSTGADLSGRTRSVSIDSRDGVSPLPDLPPAPTSYSNYQSGVPVLTAAPLPPIKKSVGPIVVSYGPNRVTPTPVIKGATVPDEAVMRDLTDWVVPVVPDEPLSQRSRLQEQQQEPQQLDGDPRRFSFDFGDEPMGSMGPLPPYASTADFYAMEKGAIRKMAEPQAQAELPPTKDGYYHDRVDVNEFELPGAAPQREPQLPFNPFRSQQQGTGGFREIDEQKFLLDDAEMAHLRAQKQKIRAAQVAAAAAAAATATAATAATAAGEPVGLEPGESYEMTETAQSSKPIAGPSSLPGIQESRVR